MKYFCRLFLLSINPLAWVFFILRNKKISVLYVSSSLALSRSQWLTVWKKPGNYFSNSFLCCTPRRSHPEPRADVNWSKASRATGDETLTTDLVLCINPRRGTRWHWILKENTARTRYYEIKNIKTSILWSVSDCSASFGFYTLNQETYCTYLCLQLIPEARNKFQLLFFSMWTLCKGFSSAWRLSLNFLTPVRAHRHSIVTIKLLGHTH